METYQLEIGEGLSAGEAARERPLPHACDARAEAAMDASFRKLTGRMRGEPSTLNHKGRSIVVPEAALGVARFTFADLCAAPLGLARLSAHRPHLSHGDYREIPVLGPSSATKPAVSLR